MIKTVISERVDGSISCHIPKWATSQGRNLITVLTTERPTPIRCLKPSTTLMPIFLFPNVPCHLEQSHKLKYSETGNVIITKPASSAVTGELENSHSIYGRNTNEMVPTTNIPYIAITKKSKRKEYTRILNGA